MFISLLKKRNSGEHDSGFVLMNFIYLKAMYNLRMTIFLAVHFHYLHIYSMVTVGKNMRLRLEPTDPGHTVLRIIYAFKVIYLKKRSLTIFVKK